MKFSSFGFVGGSIPSTTVLDKKYVYVTQGYNSYTTAPKYSNDSGTTFNNSTLPAGTNQPYHLKPVASSNGQYVIYTVFWTFVGGVYRLFKPRFSSDYGQTLTNLGPTNSAWLCAAISNDGRFGLVTATITSSPDHGVTDRILKISDYGSTTNLETLGGIIGGTFYEPGAVAVSSTGQYQVVIGNEKASGNLWWAYSSNSGSTFSVVTGSTEQGLTMLNGSGVMSDNGQYVASVYRNFGSGLVFSNDYGVTFTRKIINASGNTVTAVCMSSSGQYIYVLLTTGILRSTDYGVSFSIVSSRTGDDIQCSTDGSNVYLLYNNAIYRSTDYGSIFIITSAVTGEYFTLNKT